MLSRFRHIFGVVFFLLIASCSGGGCSGCSGCAGTTPLAGGFPTDKAVENAASVRVSRPGIDFLQTNLGPLAATAAKATNGQMTFDIPESPFDSGSVSGKICPGGPDPNAKPPKCRANIDLNSSTFLIDSVTPSAVNLEATVPLQLNDTPVSVDVGFTLTVHIGYGANGTCDGGTVKVDPKPLPLKASFPLVAETIAPRTGYTKVDVDAATVDLSAISSDDVQICADCGIASSLCNGALGLIKGTLVDQLKSGLDSQVKGMLKEQLCTKPTPNANPACPLQSSPDAKNTYCVYDADKTKCVPTLLGTDGHMDLSGALKSFSPSTTGGLDFGLASFGAMKPAPGAATSPEGRSPNGITLAMTGGVLPQPVSKCVTEKPIAPPTGVPIPDELNPTVTDPADTPHVGIALAGRFLDYAFTNVYNSGLLCLGISTEQVDMLKSGLISFLLPSLKYITFEESDAAAAIMTRPEEPPVLKLGGGTDLTKDPLLSITLPKFSIDFYIWSFDRFARIFTYTGDLSIPVNLQTGKDGLTPTLGDIKVSNGTVKNADNLLFEDPGMIAGAVSGIFGTVSKQLAGNLKPIDISNALSSVGLNLEVNKIGKLTKGTDDFLGIFATMSKKAGTALPESDTQAKLVAKRVWKDHMQAATFDVAKLPELEVELSSSLGGDQHAIEYSWWIDEGTRSPWFTEQHVSRPASGGSATTTEKSRIVIKDEQLFFQGRHVLHVVSRVAGDARTEDATPAEIPYVIDALAPVVHVERGGDGSATIKTWDVVSKTDALVARFRLDDGEFSPWRAVAEIGPIATKDADSLDVEVKDEEGNIGTVRQALRGREDPTLGAVGSGCGCSAPGARDSGGVLALALGALGLAFVVLRRRGVAFTASRAAARGGVALGAIWLLAATSQGCACGDADEQKSGCGADCNQQCLTGLKNGQPGAYLSVAKAKDGTLWAAGYNDSLLDEGDPHLWGDLVVGKYDAPKQQFAWVTVDGLPVHTDGTCPNYEPYGWRKGETEPGDDVGRYTSIQISTKGQPMVSYYDDTHHRLKFAIQDGGWKVAVLKEQSGADIGKYSKMVLVDGKPIIAYMHLEPSNTGHTRSKISLARAKVESPHEASDFDFSDVIVDDGGPCRASSCPTGEACIKSTAVCTKTVNGCQPACADGDACVLGADSKASCQAKAGTIETYPRAFGPYISLAQGPQGLGLVAYDGYHGNLVAFIEHKGAPWEGVILDGETGKRTDNSAVDTGDVGIAASLAIGPSGTWHVSYVNGSDESLRYISMTDGKPSASEVVDDGLMVDGKPHSDGKHIVGDDSVIRVDGDVVTIYYADSSSLGLRRATGTKSAAGHDWALRSIQQNNRWVAFPQFVPGENDKVAAWWRQSTRQSKTVEGNVSVIVP